MRCQRCNGENPPQAKFCVECAAPLARTCAQCGTTLPPAAKFCPECAHPTGPAVPRFTSPDSYTPRHLADKILTSLSALEGERKQVTVLFADVSGFTSLSERLDPEDVHTLMNRAFEAESAYAEAIALATTLGMRPLRARSHLGLGRLYWRVGNRARAREELGRAAAMLGAMQLPLWLGVAQTELAALA